MEGKRAAMVGRATRAASVLVDDGMLSRHDGQYRNVDAIVAICVVVVADDGDVHAEMGNFLPMGDVSFPEVRWCIESGSPQYLYA